MYRRPFTQTSYKLDAQTDGPTVDLVTIRYRLWWPWGRLRAARVLTAVLLLMEAVKENVVCDFVRSWNPPARDRNCLWRPRPYRDARDVRSSIRL